MDPDLLARMNEFVRVSSWAVWETRADGRLTGDPAFPEGAGKYVHGRAMIVSLNPGTDRLNETEKTTPAWANFHSPDRKHNDLFLASALVGTRLWGAYMTDLHSGHAESNSRELKVTPEDDRHAVLYLLVQARLLQDVAEIVAIGRRTQRALLRNSDLIMEELGLSVDRIRYIPHYSQANARVHRRDAGKYRDFVQAAITRSS